MLLGFTLDPNRVDEEMQENRESVMGSVAAEIEEGKEQK